MGNVVGIFVGIDVGSAVVGVGAADVVGELEGNDVGAALGGDDNVGAFVGFRVGSAVGSDVKVGAIEGRSVGTALGVKDKLGTSVGAKLSRAIGEIVVDCGIDDNEGASEEDAGAKDGDSEQKNV